MNRFFERKFIVQGIFIVISVILLSRLFYIQIVTDKYILSANNNVLRKLIIYPARGAILDRKEKSLVQNEPVYDLMVIPNKVKSLDTVQFCNLIEIDRVGFDKRLIKAKKYSPYKASLFEKQLSAQIYASFQEKLFQFPGFFVQNRTIRSYPDSIAAQFLGYVGEVNDRIITQSGGFYHQGDYIGISGVERSYETLLRGHRGIKNIMVDALGRAKGSFADGRYDTLAASGERLISSLDKDLQKFGEKLMQNKCGSIVAIEPSSGEILAFVSSPTYDPNLMVGRKRGYNYAKLSNNPYKPMFIRPIQAEYPPGSIFKAVNALIAQEFGAIDSNTTFNCTGGYSYGAKGFMACTHRHGPVNLRQAIAQSCNTYFGYTYNRMIDHANMRPVNAYKRWWNAVSQFGLGSRLGIDLPNERKGLLPTDKFYTKRWGSNKWGSGFNISLSIGQGELGTTPLQMANLVATIANRGFFYTPHLIKAVGEKNVIKKEYTEKHNIEIDTRFFNVIINGMSDAVNLPGGTAYFSKIPGIDMCGKTGTVENPHGKDHAVFFAFAPRQNPKIAIAVVVENVGFGATWAAPIASLMVEKYLKDTISRPPSYLDRIYLANLLPPIRIKPSINVTKSADSVKNNHNILKPTVSIQKNKAKKPNE
ncbi:MAG: penicillin-binding protein 2 [Pedobacter sp.]|nr:MAG: penicillin-binding protein 2 [Pedobacter sp.]